MSEYPHEDSDLQEIDITMDIDPALQENDDTVYEYDEHETEVSTSLVASVALSLTINARHST